MASFGGVGKEAITFVLSGDASQLIKTFGDVENAADKSLKKAETTADKIGGALTKVGAVSIGAGLGAALGLVGTIKDAEEADHAIDQLNTTILGTGSAIDSAEIQRFAKDLQQVSSVTDEQIVSASRWGATFGLTTQQLEQVLKAAADLTAQTGKSIEDTTRIIAQAASGVNVKPLEKALKVKFDPDALEGDQFLTVINGVLAQAGGAAAKGADTFTGQMDRFKKNWDDVKESIGRGADEVFEPIVSSAADLAEALATNNPELLEFIGHFAAVGSIATTAFGGLATVGGQLASLRDGFSGVGKLAEKLGLSFGGIAAGAGIAAGGVVLAGIALNNYAETQAEVAAGADAIISKFSETGDAAATLTDQINKSSGESRSIFEAFFGRTTTDPQLKALNALGIGVGDVTNLVTDNIGVWQKWHGQVEDSFRQSGRLPKDLPQQFKILLEGAAKAVRDGVPGAVDHFETLTDVMNESASTADTTASRVKLNAEAYVIAAGGAKKLTDEQRKLVDTAKNDPSLDKRLAALDALAKLNPKVAETIGLVADADEDAKKKAEDAAAAMEKQISAFQDLIKNSQSGAQFMRDFGHALDDVKAKGLATSLEQLDTDEVTTGFLDMGDAMAEMKDNAKNLPPEFNALKAATNGYSDEQDKAIKATIGFASSLKDQASQLLAAGGSTDFVKAFLKKGQQDIVAAGGEKWLEQLGLTDQQIDIAIKLAGEEEARAKLEFLSVMINQQFPPDVVREINLRASTGDFTGALLIAQAEMLKLQALNGEIVIDANADGVTSAVEMVNALITAGIVDPKKTEIDADHDGVISEVEATNFLLTHGIKTPAPVPLTASDQASGTIGHVGDALSNLDGRSATVIIRTAGEQAARQHIQEIKDLNASGGPRAMAMAATTSNMTVNVTMPAGSDGASVTRALRRHAARNGTRYR